MQLSHTLPLALLALPLLTACTPENKFAAKSAKVACDRLEKCGSLDAFGGDYDGCTQQLEDSAQQAIDNCDNYSGSLAYRCLQQIKKASCEETDQPQACEKFDDKCGFNNQTAIVEYENGMSAYGLMNYRFHE